MKPTFLTIPGLGCEPVADVPAQTVHEFDRDGVARIRVGCHPNTPAGWRTASMKVTLSDPASCAVFFSTNARHIHAVVEGNSVCHWLTLTRNLVANLPPGWTNLAVEFAGRTRTEHFFHVPCKSCSA